MEEKELAKWSGLAREAIWLMGWAACIWLAWWLVSAINVFPILKWLIALAAPVAALAALCYVVTRFVAIVYHLSNRDAFNYWTMSAFGPISPSIPLIRDYPFLIVRNGQVEKKDRATTLYNLGGPGTVVVFSDSAVVLECNGLQTRIEGPCVKFMRPFELVREMVDLRPHVRQVPAKVVTKDGILIEADVQASFQLMMDPDHHPTDKSPYSPLKQELRKAALVQTNFNKERVMNWADRVNGNLDSALRSIVSDYAFDDLFDVSPDGAAADARRAILERLRAELTGAARNFGANLLDVRLSAFRIPSDSLNKKVQEQRVDSWKAGREGQAQATLAGGEARAMEQHAQVEREARERMVREIVACLKRSELDPQATNDLVALRLVETLDKIRTSSEAGIFIPRETADTLETLRSMLNPSQEN